MRAVSITAAVVTVLSLAAAPTAGAAPAGPALTGAAAAGAAPPASQPGTVALAPSARTPAGRGKTRPADNSGGQPECWDTDSSSCASLNPTVSLTFYSNGDTSDCSFTLDLDWGDGNTSETTVAGGPDGSQLATMDHSYGDTPGSFSIDWTSTAFGDCTDSSGSLSFTLLSPPSGDEQGGGPNPSEDDSNCDGGDPVNCATGVFWQDFTDLSVPGRGVPLRLTRSYESSRAAISGPFGYGWTDSYAMSLASDASANVTVTQEDGTTVSFSPDGSGGYTAPARVQATLDKNANGSYTFTRSRSQVSYVFNAAGELTSETDLDDSVTTLAYNASGELANVTDPAGRTLTFTYSGSRIATASDPLGRTYRYAYDSAGNLVKATDPLGRARSFSYDGKHRLLTITDPRGETTSNVYSSGGQVTAQVDPDGGKSAWSYTGSAGTLAGGSTTLTDPDGDRTTYEYSDLEMLSVTSGVGTASAATTRYTYDPSTLGIVSATDPDGNTTDNTYDANGNLLTSTDPLGKTTSYTYNDLNEVLSETDPLGDTSYRSYDAAGNLLTVADPLGNGTTYGYADATHPGDITSVTDPDGHVTSYAYDKYGNVAAASVTPSAGVTDTTAYAYDLDGERYCTVSPKDVAAGVTCATAGSPAKAGATSTAFDADGEVTSVTDADGHATRYTDNADGEQASVTTAAGQVTSYGYDGDGRQGTQTQPDGSVLATAYDPDGNITSKVNAAGQKTRYTYDPLGRVVTATNPLGQVTKYTYDEAGNQLTLTDAADRVSAYSYDKDGGLAGVSYADGKTPPVAYGYDADGRRTSMTDGTGTTTYTYDADGRATSIQDGAGLTVGDAYDPAGLLTAITYPNGEAVTRGYDRAGELTSVSDWLGNTTTFGYDRDGDLTSEGYPNGVSAQPAYDKADLLTSITDKKGSSTVATFAYGRNSLGEVTSDAETGAVSGVRSYSYTQLSQLASSGAGKYRYDLANDLTAQPGGETQAFNPGGQLTSTSAPRPVTSGPSVAASVSGSQLGQGSSVTSPALTTKAGSDLAVAFISVAGPPGKSQQVTSVTGGGLAWKLVTRADGEQGTAEVWQAPAAKALSKATVTAAFRDKGYDGAITVAAFSGARSAVGAHATGGKASGPPSVSVTTTGTDSAIWVVGEDPSAAKSRTADSGQSVVHQVLDTARKATFWAQRSGIIAKPGTAVKAGDTAPAGDKWDLTAVEILAAVPSVETSYAYDKAGDLVSAGSTTFGYDQAGELTSDGKNATYAYNGDGLRMSKTVGGTTSDFAWDTAGSGPVVIAAGSTYSLYGPGNQPIEQITGATPNYLLDDGAGSTRLITSATGAVIGTYAYSPYGAVTRHTGSASTALQYDGQYTDAESGLQYLQSRYYDPAIGQFLTTDPLTPLTGEPYGYAGGNPVNLADPSGMFALPYALAGGGTAAAVEEGILGAGTLAEGGGLLAGIGACFASVVCGVAVVGAAALAATAIIVNQGNHASNSEATSGSTSTTGTTAGETTESEDPDCDTGQQSVPQNAQDALDKIDEGEWPPPGAKGGGNFANDGRGGGDVLPPADADGNPITYKEWDVNPAGPNGRDAERIVTGSDGSAFYTNDHYGTFTRMR